MKISWDPAKARANFQKHQIRFADAEAVLYDPDAITIEDPDTKMQQRFVTMGIDAGGRILVVVYAYQGEDIRLISARRASPGESKGYEKRV